MCVAMQWSSYCFPLQAPVGIYRLCQNLLNSYVPAELRKQILREWVKEAIESAMRIDSQFFVAADFHFFITAGTMVVTTR